MTQPKKKTAFVPCKSFKHDGATLTVGVAEVTVNRKPNPSEVYLCVKYFGDEGTPEAVVTFTPDKVIEIAEALLGFARVAQTGWAGINPPILESKGRKLFPAFWFRQAKCTKNRGMSRMNPKKNAEAASGTTAL